MIHVIEKFLHANFSILLGLLDLIVDIFANSLLNLLDFMLRDQTCSDDLVSESRDGISTLPDFLNFISTPEDTISEIENVKSK